VFLLDLAGHGPFTDNIKPVLFASHAIVLLYMHWIINMGYNHTVIRFLLRDSTAQEVAVVMMGSSVKGWLRRGVGKTGYINIDVVRLQGGSHTFEFHLNFQTTTQKN
jgi:hypothetical protein